MSRELTVAGGKVALVDDDDYQRVSAERWFLSGGYPSRTIRGENGKRIHQGLHRFILNPQARQEVDHINHNPLDNQKNNLRVCSRTQNQQNRIRGRNNRSGFKGVDWVERDSRWRATIRVNGRLLYLGYFREPTAAARAYDEAAHKYFGEFAKTNFQ